jgi:hypothetical protein
MLRPGEFAVVLRKVAYSVLRTHSIAGHSRYDARPSIHSVLIKQKMWRPQRRCRARPDLALMREEDQ